MESLLVKAHVLGFQHFLTVSFDVVHFIEVGVVRLVS